MSDVAADLTATAIFQPSSSSPAAGTNGVAETMRATIQSLIAADNGLSTLDALIQAAETSLATKTSTIVESGGSGGLGSTGGTYAARPAGVTGVVLYVGADNPTTSSAANNGAPALATDVWLAYGTSGGSSSSGATLDTTASDIQPLGVQSAGSKGLAADAGHVHPLGNILTTTVAEGLFSPLGTPNWTANTQFVSGEMVINPSGYVVYALSTFTSGTTYNPSNWSAVSPAGGSLDTTATDIAPMGNQAAGAKGLAADAGHVHPAPGWLPSDSGLKAWAYDHALAASSLILTGGTVYFAKVRISAPTLITNVLVNVATAGSGATANQCGMAIYDATGAATRYAVTGDASTAFNTLGVTPVALTAAVTLNPGIYTVAFWANASTTLPTVSRGATNLVSNVGMTGSSARFGTAQTGVTAAPATLSGMAAAGNAWWVGLS